MRVLLVEDDDLIAHGIQSGLRARGLTGGWRENRGAGRGYDTKDTRGPWFAVFTMTTPPSIPKRLHTSQHPTSSAKADIQGLNICYQFSIMLGFPLIAFYSFA